MKDWFSGDALIRKAAGISNLFLQAGLEWECIYILGETVDGVRTQSELTEVLRGIRLQSPCVARSVTSLWSQCQDYLLPDVINPLKGLVVPHAAVEVVVAGLSMEQSIYLGHSPGEPCLSYRSFTNRPEQWARIGTEWLQQGRLEGVPLVAAAWRSKVAGTLIVGDFDRLLGQIEPRPIPKITSGLLSQVAGLARDFADVGRHSSAIGLGLMVPCLTGNESSLRLVTQSMMGIDAFAEPYRTSALSGVEGAIKFLELGYPAQAAELCRASFDLPEANNVTWKRAWSILEKDILDNTPNIEDSRSTRFVRGIKGVVHSVASAFSAEKPIPFESVVKDVVEAELSRSPDAPSREVNVWLEDAKLPFPIEQKVKLGIDIGRPHLPAEEETPVSSQPFREPPWGDRQQLELLIGLMGPYVTVEPIWQHCVLPRKAPMAPIYFDVIAHRAGLLELVLTLRLPKSMTLLQGYRLELETYDSANACRMETVNP